MSTDRSIKAKLFLSHLRVAGIGFASLLLIALATQLLRTNALRLAQERGPVVNASLQALGGVQRSVAELSGWVAFGDVVFRERRDAAWRHEIRPAVNELYRATWLWGDLEERRVDELRQMLDGLEALQRRIESLAHSSESGSRDDEVQQLMQSDLVPQGRRVIGFQRGVSAGQMALMEVDAESVSLISRAGFTLSAILVCVMGFMAWSFSARAAERITEPIRRLAHATEDLAQGRLAQDIPVTESDEVGQLTATFNSLRTSLVRTTHSLRETADRLGDATSQILATTTQQAKATREQAAAVRANLENLQEAEAIARPVAERSAALVKSVESASDAGQSGRRALEEWISAMAGLRARVENEHGVPPMDAAIGQSLETMNALMQRIHDVMETLTGLPKEGGQLAASTGSSVQAQAGHLAEVHRAMERLNQLGEQSLERTFHVERVAQDLKAHSRTLMEVAAIYQHFDPEPGKSN